MRDEVIRAWMPSAVLRGFCRARKRLRAEYTEVWRARIGFGGSLRLLRKRIRWVEPRVPLLAEIGYNAYGAYCVPLSCRRRPASQAVLRCRVHEPDTIEYIRQHCDDGDVVHAGTFFGDFLPGIAHALADDGVLWTFEPNEESFRCAEITVRLNDLKNVRLCHAGLGAEQGIGFVRTHDPSGKPLGGASSLRGDPTATASNGAAVAVVPLDEVVPSDRRLSVVQLDVEGLEEQASRGALSTIRRCRPILILEILADSDLLESDFFESEIRRLGYRNMGRVANNLVFAT